MLRILLGLLDVRRKFALLYVALEELDYGWKIGAVVEFSQDLSPRFEMTDYLACHFERIARNLSSTCSTLYSNCTASNTGVME